MSELKALQAEVQPQSQLSVSEAPSEVDSARASTGLISLRLRRIGRYVECTVPELLPERAEAAEILVNVARFAAGLMVQENEWNASGVASEIEMWLNQLSAMPIVN